MDPYLLLGVSRRSSIEEINRAYKALLEKYSEENYASGPMAELAQKKRRELEEAYDCIIKEKAATQQGSQSQGGYNNYNGNAGAETSGGGYTNSNPIYAQVRNCIDAGNVSEARRLLNSVSVRDGEWYYLSGCAALRSGMYNEAYNYFKIATNKEPQNQEYRAAYMRMEQQSQSYRNYGSELEQAQCCNCCSNLLIADCCCECLGGDLVPCC